MIDVSTTTKAMTKRILAETDSEKRRSVRAVIHAPVFVASEPERRKPEGK